MNILEMDFPVTPRRGAEAATSAATARGRGWLHGALLLCALLSLLVTLEPARAVPRFTSTPVTAVNEDAAYRYDISTADSQNGERRVTAVTLPSWLTLSNEGRNGAARITGTPTQGQVGTHAVSLRVQNLRTNSAALQNFSIVVTNVNDAPVITGQAPNPIPVQQGTAFTITLAHVLVTDVDNAYPTGFTLTVMNGTNYTRNGNTITPTATFTGTLSVPVRVSDGAANSNTFNLAVSVARSQPADLSLEVSATPSPALVGAPVEWRFTIANVSPHSSTAAQFTADFIGNPFGFTDLASCSVTPVTDRQRLACNVPVVPGGTSTPVVVRGIAAQGGDVFVMTSVAGTSSDPTPANNAAETTLHIAEILSAGPAQQLPTPNATGAAAGDVNGDGFADVVLTRNAADAAAELYLNVVEGTDPARRKLATMPLLIGDPAAASNVALFDVDLDADLDLVTTSSTGGSNTLYRNAGSGAFARSGTLGGGRSYDVAAADFDRDGAIDLAFANAGPNTVYLNRGASGFTRAADVGDGDNREVVAVDFDLDGLADLVFANASGPSRFHRNLGAGTFGTGVVVDTGGAHTVAAGDLNGDGRPDLVFGLRDDATGAPSRPVYQNNPGAPGSPLFVLLRRLGASSATQVLTADVDADGALDVVSLNATGTHQVYRGDGAGGLRLHGVQFGWAGATSAALSKISVDASLDIVIAGSTNSAVFFADGRGGFGLGDTTPPVIQLLGDPLATVTIGESYVDAGATATDNLDGNLTPRIVIVNPVNTTIVGTYIVTYDVKDGSGNPAAQGRRTVRVAAREGVGGGGGGATDLWVVVMLVVLLACRRSRAMKW
jgi:hypothetical protein